jgi:hypothetical protein
MISGGLKPGWRRLEKKDERKAVRSGVMAFDSEELATHYSSI